MTGGTRQSGAGCQLTEGERGDLKKDLSCPRDSRVKGRETSGLVAWWAREMTAGFDRATILCVAGSRSMAAVCDVVDVSMSSMPNEDVHFGIVSKTGAPEMSARLFRQPEAGET